MDNTMQFKISEENGTEAHEILILVYKALEEKGYNPINQIVGYLVSGDSAYIPRHNNARSLIKKVERNEIIEALVKAYLLPKES